MGGGQRTDRRARGRDGRQAVETKKNNDHGRSKPTRQKKKARRRGPTPRRTGAGWGDMGPHGTHGGPKGKTPPHRCSHALCLRRACVMPATCVLQREDDKGDKGDDGSGMLTPPGGTAAGWGGSGKRVRDEPHDRAQREHAPCKPQRGDHRGCDRRKGRVTTGATRQATPPCRGTSAAPRVCAVLATCLRQRTDSEDAPPPHSLLLHPAKKGARSARRQRGDMEGGAEDRPKRRGERREASGKKKTKKTKNKAARAGADSRGRRDMVGARKHGKGRGKGGRPWGQKFGGRDQRRSKRGGAGVTRAHKRRW